MRAGGRLRRASGILALMVALFPGAVRAQDPAPVELPVEGVATAPPMVVLTLDQDRLFLESRFGKASLAREGDASRALEQENNRIEAELVAEEQDLTARRATLPAAEFSALAAAFDTKVERIRDEQDAKVRAVALARDEDRKAFLRAIGPVLGELMGEKGAVAILDKSTVIVSLIAIDVTDEAIARVDAVLPIGTLAPDAP